MDFELSDEQRLLQDTVRRFVDDRILPNAIENDIRHHLDMGAIEGMAELGILGIVVPEEYGGAGLDFVCEALACEEIERGEAAFRTLISVHVGLNSLSLLRYGTEEQKRRWVVPAAGGAERPPRTCSARRGRASRSPCTRSTTVASRSRQVRAASSARASSARSTTRWN